MLLPRSGPECHRIFLSGEVQLAQEELADFTRRSHPLNSANDIVVFEEKFQQLTQRLHASLAALAVQDSLLSTRPVQKPCPA